MPASLPPKSDKATATPSSRSRPAGDRTWTMSLAAAQGTAITSCFGSARARRACLPIPGTSRRRPRRAGQFTKIEEFARHARGLLNATHPPQVAEPRGHAARNRRQTGNCSRDPPAEDRRPMLHSRPAVPAEVDDRLSIALSRNRSRASRAGGARCGGDRPAGSPHPSSLSASSHHSDRICVTVVCRACACRR